MGAVELSRVVLTTELAENIGRGAVTVVNLKKVKIAVCAALQMKIGKGNPEDLKRKAKMSSILLRGALTPTECCALTFCDQAAEKAAMLRPTLLASVWTTQAQLTW